jgi:uncharacterized membrane-anchored protein
MLSTTIVLSPIISILGDLVIVSLRFFLNLKQTGQLG